VPAHLRGDSLRLQQVLLNLVGNALKFTAAGEVVLSVCLRESGDRDALLAFTVRDTGIGIAPERQAGLFEGFAQADASIARRFGGTGLGLAISQRLVGLMGGTIRLSSVPGEGSVFEFEIRLPLDNEVPRAAVPAPRAAQGAPLRAMIVDDHEGARAALVRMAESLGWSVLAAADLAGAGSLASTVRQAGTPLDIVFMDAGLAGGEAGSAPLASRMGLGEPLPPIVLLVSSHDADGRVLDETALRATCEGFLVKPVIASMLHDALQDARQGTGLDAVRQPMSRPGALPLAGLRLLVVEDNANNRQVAQELLEAEGALVSLANDGQEGVSAVLRADPGFDAVLMDIRMPTMDGLDATRRIREFAHLRSLPIIAMTANVSTEDRLSSEAAGMNAHVGKPFALGELCSVILRLCGRGAVVPSTAGTAAGMPDAVAEAGRAAGLDVDTAIHRFSGQVGVYGRMLRGFLADLPATITHIEEAVDQGGLGQASAAFHSLKGVAANVGARALSELAEAGEQACESDSAQAVLRDLLGAIRDAGDRLCRQGPAVSDALLAPGVIVASDADAPAQPVPTEALKPVLARLLPLLRRSDMRAVDVLDELRALASASPDPKALAEIEAAVDRLDFELAAALCVRLAGDGGWPPPPSARHHPA
jgi:CheY-like chemotaxis protein